MARHENVMCSKGSSEIHCGGSADVGEEVMEGEKGGGGKEGDVM